MNKKRLIITSIISIILVTTLMLGSTYSLFSYSEENTALENNIYTTGVLDITYTLSSDNVTLTNSTPTSVEDANAIIPYHITVNNKGTVPYMFDLILEDNTASASIDYQYIMTKVGYIEPKTLESCTNNIIKEDIIIPAGESVDIDVRVWLSDTLKNTEIGKSFFAKLVIDGLAIYDKNETIDNSILSLSYMKGFSGNSDTSYFHNSTYQTKIKNIAFVDYIDTTNAVASWDMSESKDESVIAWVVNNETEGYYDLYIGAKRMICAKNLQYFFYNMSAVDSISFDNLDTSLTTNMKSMFYYTGYSSTVFTLDLGEKFDTSNVTNMDGMFSETGYSNSNLELDLSTFTFDKVTSYNNMFLYFRSTQKIYVANATQQSWLLDKEFSNVTSNNVIIKS